MIYAKAMEQLTQFLTAIGDRHSLIKDQIGDQHRVMRIVLCHSLPFYRVQREMEGTHPLFHLPLQLLPATPYSQRLAPAIVHGITTKVWSVREMIETVLDT